MDVNISFLLVQLINITLLILWIVIILWSFRRLNKRVMSASQRLGWAAIIIFVPILGGLAFLVTHPLRASPATD